MKKFWILLFVSFFCLNFTGCKKILRSVAKDGTEDVAKLGAKDFAKDGLKKEITKSDGEYFGRAASDRLIKRAARNEVEKGMEKEGIHSFAELGEKRAGQAIEKTATSDAKKEILLSSNKAYKESILKSSKMVKAGVVRTFAGRDAYAYMNKNLPDVARAIDNFSKKNLANGYHLGKNQFELSMLKDGSVEIKPMSNFSGGVTNCVIKVKGRTVYANSGGFVKSQGLNEFLNVPMPNREYIVNGCAIYRTDKLGRVVEASADRLKMYRGPKVNPQRYGPTQKQVVNELEGIRGGHDQGGHLFSNTSNGSNVLINQVPMEAETNMHGEWRNFEKLEEKYIKSGKYKSDLSYRQPLYKGNSKRPYAIKVRLVVNGKAVAQKTISNPILKKRVA